MAGWYWSTQPDWRTLRLLESEFVAGSHVACAQYCIVCGRKAQLGVVPVPADLYAVQERDTKAGILKNGGTVMSGVYRDLATLANPKVSPSNLRYWSFTPSGYSRETVMAAIESGRGGGKFVIVQVLRAYNLPNNEAGVKSHYIALLGASTLTNTAKVLVANGDREPHSNLPEWYAVDQLMQALPCAMLSVQGLR